MSGGINFVQNNPAIDAFSRGMQEHDRQRQSMIQAESGAQRNAMGAATAPFEMRQTQARTSQSEDSARFSRATLGNRITQSNVATTQAELRGFYESLKLLEQGDVEGARYVAEQYGQQIPEGIFQNRAVQRQLSIIASEAQTRYPNNPRKQQEFIQYAVQGLQDETEGAGRVTDPLFPYSVPGAPEADEFAPGRSGGRAGGTTIYHTRYDLFRRNGFSELEADAFASGRRQPSAQDVVRIADARTRDQVRAMPSWNQPSAEEMQAMRDENLRRVREDLRSAGFDFDIPQPGSTGPETGFDSRWGEGTGQGFSSDPAQMQGGDMGSRLLQIGRDPLPDVAPITAPRQSEAAPPAPQDPSQRVEGMLYMAPDGRRVIWRGTGWELAE